MQSDPVNLLFVEDSEVDVELAVYALKRDGMEVLWQRVDSEKALRAALGVLKPDIILSDFSMPQFDGLQALSLARGMAPDVPFIFVSGTIGEERAVDAIRCGATDYILKNNMPRLIAAVRRALAESVEDGQMRRA